MSELLSIITSQFPAAPVSCEGIKHADDFESLKTEIGKLGNIDYELVETVSVKITKDGPKDIRVLLYMSLAFLRKDDWERFSEVFEGLGILGEREFGSLYPTRDRARELAFRWLSEDRFLSLLSLKKPSETAYPHIAKLLESLQKLKSILEKNFPQSSPFPVEFFKQVQSWEKSLKPAPTFSTPETSQQAISEARTGSENSNYDSTHGSIDVIETPRQAQELVRKAALFLIKKEPLKPAGYRLLRCARWDQLVSAPPSRNGITQLPGPSIQLRDFIKKFSSQTDWKVVLDNSETFFAGGANHFLLDLQRISVTACVKLGVQYSLIGDMIIKETAVLIGRIPELVSLSFSDGTPFCDEETRIRFDSEINHVRAQISDSQVAGAVCDPVENDAKTVDSLIASSRFEEALDYLQNRIRESTVERDNFRRLVLMGKLLVKADQPDVAVSVLEALDIRIESHHLEKWDPLFALEAWSALFEAQKAVKIRKPQHFRPEKQSAVLGKISRIDPKKAFLLNK